MADDRSLTRFRRMLCAAGVAVALVSGLLAPAAGSATTTPVADGRTEATAAGSCWEVLQNDPSAQDGVYWLITPTLVAPQQFYCDQTHRGGGWVLIAPGGRAGRRITTGSGLRRRLRPSRPASRRSPPPSFRLT